MKMSKKAGKQTKKSTKSASKAKKEYLPVIPNWNDAMVKVILNNTHDGIVILGEDYKFEFINERGLAIYGGQASDLIGKDFRKFMKEDMVKMVAEYYDMRRRGEDVPSVYSFRLIRKDGSEVTVEGRVTLVMGPDEKPKIIAHLQDITQIERNLRDLEESKTRYKLLVETMNDGLAIDNVNGELTYVNDAFCRMLGCQAGELIGKHWSDLTEEMTPEDVHEKLKEREKGVTESYELTWSHKTGKTVPTIVSATPYIGHDGKFAGTFAVVTEISDQKNAEESIQFYYRL